MISPEAMLVIATVACTVVIGLVVADHGKTQALRLAKISTEGASYADAMRYLAVSEDHPEGMLVGLWGADSNAEAWWWRCSLCREHDLWLSPEACALASSAHVCSPIDLEAAKAEAKRQHPAYRPAFTEDQCRGGCDECAGGHA